MEIRTFEWLSLTFGGVIGWVVGKFEPAFPLIIIATLFVLYDAWSAYELDKRVHIMYPKQKREKAKFMSYKFRNVIPTLTERFVIIILAYCVERWVFVHIDVPVSYIAAGVVCAEQMLYYAALNCMYNLSLIVKEENENYKNQAKELKKHLDEKEIKVSAIGMQFLPIPHPKSRMFIYSFSVNTFCLIKSVLPGSITT